ncbi:MAG TPA: adenylate/guanylate cyclase domain-containing protein [Usitatibacter sp.]|jgi:class 3 adenylate cyclase|nr:adenylate/guanylate cyclase domain-containing protein [Usitatibacter sp.]
MAATVTRKLAAILAADAVGYSRLMGRNEEGTVQVLSSHRVVIDGLIEAHHGRIVGTAGDSVLAEFASAVGALRCAVEIQQALETRNAALPEASRMRFRIGINLGDVVVKGDDLLGDGVNVAARIEGIAEPGGICISSSVYDQIAGKLDLGFVEMGEQALKNIDRPIRVYRVAAGVSGTVRAKRPMRRAHAAVGGVALLAALGAIVWLEYGPPFPDGVALPQAVALPGPGVAAPTNPSAADEARKMAEERLDVAHREAQAELASEKARSGLEIAKLRAEAEVARARAEAETLRRQAAAELAAARVTPASSVTTPGSAKPIATSTPASPQPMPALALASPASPPAKSGAPASAPPPERWIGTLQCGAYFGAPQVADEVKVRMENGMFQLTRRPEGVPGHISATGKPSSDGALQLTGTAIGTRGIRRGEELEVLLSGRMESGRYVTKGTLGTRPCMLEIARDK